MMDLASMHTRPLGLVVLLAAGCHTPDAPVLTVAHEAEVASLDPLTASDTIANSVLSNIYDPLVDYDSGMRIAPALAVSWSTPDERTWLLQLRRGVRFHDGHPLTAADVKLCLDRARSDPASALRDRLTTLESVEAVGAHSVRIRTTVPDPLLLTRLVPVLVTPPGSGARLAVRPIGTGAYRFVLRNDRVIEMESYPGYWRGRADFGRVRFVTVEPGEGTQAALRGEGLQVLRWVPEALVRSIEAIPSVRVERHSSLRAVYLWMNSQADVNRRNPLSDVRVRKAIAMAIDRQRLVEQLYGQATALNQVVPPGVVGHVPGLAELGPDPAGAKRLLAESQLKEDLTIDLAHAPGAESLAEVVRRDLARVGIRARPVPLKWPEMLASWRSARLPLFIASWRFEDGEPSLFFRECLASRGVGEAIAWNPGFSDPGVDALIRENFSLFDEPERVAQFEQLARAALEKMPLVPLFVRVDLYAVAGKVEWQPRMDGRLLAAEMRWRGP
jgi:peptide/nickel transport system substrate-binding protein